MGNSASGNRATNFYLSAARFPRSLRALLLARSEVAFFGAHLIAAIVAVEIDGAEGAVVFEFGRRVGERVLAAQLLFNLLEAVGHLFDRWRKEDLAAGGLGHIGEDLVAPAAARGPVGADGIDDGLGALALLDGFVGMDAALVVVAVGDEDHGLAHRLLTALAQKLVAAGGVDGVKKRSAAAGTHAVNAGFESIDVIGPVLLNSGRYVEAHDEGAVAARFEDIDEKLSGRLLFEL